MLAEVGLQELFFRVGVSLALGLLIGLERGWHERGEEQGGGARILGTRTFGLIGLLGALTALLDSHLVLAMAFAGLAAAVIVAHVLAARVDQDYGITTVVAALVVFAAGAASVLGYVGLAAAIGVVMVTLLGLRPYLHELEQRLSRQELQATFKLLLISVVLLPVLPNRGFGPWQALNPYEIWWMVVLIAGISYAGYFAIRFGGARHGLGLTGLLGGLVSSTAVCLSFARMGRKRPHIHAALAAGSLAAAGTMFPRILVVAGVVYLPLAMALLPSMAAMALVTYGAALWFWRRSAHGPQDAGSLVQNPFEIKPALQFAALLVAVMLLARALQAWLGDVGVYLLAAVSGVSDVDAVNLSLSRMARSGLEVRVAAVAVFIAAAVNSAFKGCLALGIGRGKLGRWVFLGMGASIVVGLLAMLVVPLP
jgi:uncharacterized membrane protein (DUF4010 family)